MSKRYTYYLRKPDGEEVPFTGSFENKREADLWHKRNFEWWRDRGRNLIRKEIKEQT